MAIHKGYRIVGCDKEFNVKTVQTSCNVDLKIGSTIGGTGSDRIFLGITSEFVGDYYSGLTDSDDVLLSYVYDDADVLQGDPDSFLDTEVVVSKARFLDACFYDLQTQLEKGHILREKVIPATFELNEPTKSNVSKHLLVDVYHKTRWGDPELVATIAVEDKGDSNRATLDVLTMAYKATKNFDGAWSMGETFKDDGKDVKNTDYNPDVTVIKELNSRNGRALGHRSSMVGDILEVRGTSFEVDHVGFKRIAPNKVSDTEFNLG